MRLRRRRPETEQQRRQRAIEEARRVRRFEAKEHKHLAPRSVEEWNHSDQCKPCNRKKAKRLHGR